MKSRQEPTSISEGLCHEENLGIYYPQFVTYPASQPAKTLGAQIDSVLARNLLFICENCGGPLVPSNECLVCKKTEKRICVGCGLKKTVGNHSSCNDLILFGGIIKSLHHKRH